MTLAARLLLGLVALGSSALAPAQTAEPYQDKLIVGLPPPTDENDGVSDYDREGWPRYLRFETRLGTLAFDAERRARLAYALDAMVETPNYGVLSVDGSVAPSPRHQTLTLRQRELPLPGGWVGQHELGIITAPATPLAQQPSRVMLPGTHLRGLRGEWAQNDNGLQLLAATGEPGQLTSQPAEGFEGLGGRRSLAGAQWNSPGVTPVDPDGWTFAAQHERGTDLLLPGADELTGRTAASASHLALRRDTPDLHTQAQFVDSRIAAGKVRARGYWIDSDWSEGPRKHGLSAYRLEPGLSWAGQAMPEDVQGVTLRSLWRTRQWSAEISYDWLRSVTGRLASGSYASANARWRYDRDNQLNAGASLRRYNGNAWSSFLDWRRNSDWGNSGLRLELAGGTDFQGPVRAITWDQEWANALGWTVSTSLGAGTYRSSAQSTDGSASDDPFWSAALALQAPIGNGADLRGQLTTDQRADGQHRYALNLGGQWRINRHWGFSSQYTRTLGQSPQRRPLDPLAPAVTDTLTTGDRSFLAVLRYDVDAGSRSVPLGGKPQSGGGRIEGVVFFDANRSGTQDASETGAPGVTVALDNRYAVRTDPQGRFSFPFVATGPRTISVRNDTLPLPWSVVDDGQVRIDVRLRETTRLSLPVQRAD